MRRVLMLPSGADIMLAMTGLLLSCTSWAAWEENDVVVRYTRAAVDSHAKAVLKVRELEVMQGVMKAAALECLGSILVSCTSGDARKQLVKDLVADPTVEATMNSSMRLPQCENEGSQVDVRDMEMPALLRVTNHSNRSRHAAVFEARLRAFSTPAFSDEVLVDQISLPMSADRIFFEALTSTFDSGLASFANCTVSPFEDDVSSRVSVITDSCPQGEFDFRRHEGGRPGSVRMSMRRFQFIGQSQLILFCTVLRCGAEPCAECGRDVQSRIDVEVASAKIRLLTPSCSGGAASTCAERGWLLLGNAREPPSPPAQADSEESGIVQGSEIVFEAIPVFEVVMIEGISAHTAARHREAIARTIAASLRGIGLQDLQILRVVDPDNQRPLSNKGRQRRQRQALRKAKAGLIASAQIDFEVVPSYAAHAETMDQVEAWLLLLREGGPAAESFSAALASALKEDGLVSLPLHFKAVFGTPRRGLVTEEEAKTSQSGGAHSGQNADDGDILFLVLFVFVFGIVSVILVIVLFASISQF